MVSGPNPIMELLLLRLLGQGSPGKHWRQQASKEMVLHPQKEENGAGFPSSWTEPSGLEKTLVIPRLLQLPSFLSLIKSLCSDLL